MLTARHDLILQLRILDERFQLYCSINWCFMHQATIGLFGHVVKSIIHKVEITLRDKLYSKGTSEDGQPKYVIGMPRLEGIWKRAARRLTHVSSDISGYQLTPKYAAQVLQVFLYGKSTLTAVRFELLLLALPFVLIDLIDPELRSIEQAIRQGKVDKDSKGNLPARPQDPCPDMVRALACFLDWYMQARLLMFPVDMAPELQRRANVMKETLQEVFPDKSGQKAAWNFPNMHASDHKASEILGHGSTIFTETGPFETGHKHNIKDLSGNSNGKDQFITIAKYHDRASNVTKLKQAISRNSRFLSREDESDSGSSSDAAQADDEDDDDVLTDTTSSRPCEMAVRMPLWDMVCQAKDLRRVLISLGKKRRGRQRISLLQFATGVPARSSSQANKGKAPATGPPARSSSQANKGSSQTNKRKFLYNYAEENSDLRYLVPQLAHFAHEYLRIGLGLPDVPEKQRDIDGTLQRYLVRDADGADIFTFGGVAIRSLHSKGTVRVRSRPFPSDKFFGKNMQVVARSSLAMVM